MRKTENIRKVAPKDHIFGIARMWESRAVGTGWLIRVGRSSSEVNVWFAEMLARFRPNLSSRPTSKLESRPRALRKPFAAPVVITDVASERQIGPLTHKAPRCGIERLAGSWPEALLDMHSGTVFTAAFIPDIRIESAERGRQSLNVGSEPAP